MIKGHTHVSHFDVIRVPALYVRGMVRHMTCRTLSDSYFLYVCYSYIICTICATALYLIRTSCTFHIRTSDVRYGLRHFI